MKVNGAGVKDEIGLEGNVSARDEIICLDYYIEFNYTFALMAVTVKK